jgi:hypothetical protein
MTSPIWLTPAGFLGTLTERKTVAVPLRATGTNLTYSLIAGNLPTGVALNTSTGVLLGTPVSVANNTDKKFVIRAENVDGLSDRTFNVTITGPTKPVWATAEGTLRTGLNNEYYTINKEYVDYTLRAETDILASGNSLKYYIADGDGQLPPGLNLTQNGRITGYVNDLLKLDLSVSINGGYDLDSYGVYPYDHATFDQNVLEYTRPAAINKTYQFYVTVTDGFASARRLFSIEVVDPDTLRADNTYVHADTKKYDISASYLLAPIWQSGFGGLLPKPANLGTIRASREEVISLHDYDPYPLVGPVIFDWSTTVNPEIKLVTDSKFNVAGFETVNLKGDTKIYFKDTVLFPVSGMKVRLDEYIVGANATTYTIIDVVKDPFNENKGFIILDQPLAEQIPDSRTMYVGTLSEHPVGLELDSQTGDLYGRIPYQPAYSKSYRFTVKTIKTDQNTGSTVAASQIFILTVKGDIESYIQFISTSSLGVLVPGQISEIAVVAENVNTEYNVEYSLVSGILPAGLTLNSDGTIRGTIKYKSQTYFDLFPTDGNPSGFDFFKLDGGSTTIDRNWNFTIRATDVYKLSAVDKTFYITVLEESLTEYTRIFVKPFLSPEKRISYRDFITNSTTFDPSLIYRPNDPEFGVQPQIKMVVETGIEKVSIEKYVEAMQEHFYRKRFFFGEVNSILAKDSSGNSVYELIYVDIVDDQMGGNYSPNYAISLGNMQTRLEEIVINSDRTILVDERLQPRYMTTLQTNTGIPLGFIKAVPICYVLPGNSEKVLSRIKSSGFDFKQIDFDTDRIIVETPVEPDENGWLFYPTS